MRRKIDIMQKLCILPTPCIINTFTIYISSTHNLHVRCEQYLQIFSTIVQKHVTPKIKVNEKKQWYSAKTVYISDTMYNQYFQNIYFQHFKYIMSSYLRSFNTSNTSCHPTCTLSTLQTHHVILPAHFQHKNTSCHQTCALSTLQAHHVILLTYL